MASRSVRRESRRLEAVVGGEEGACDEGGDGDEEGEDDADGGRWGRGRVNGRGVGSEGGLVLGGGGSRVGAAAGAFVEGELEGVGEGGEGGADGFGAPVGIDGESLDEPPVERAGERRGELGCARERHPRFGFGELLAGVGDEGGAAGERVVGDGAERPDVGARIGVTICARTGKLLWARVGEHVEARLVDGAGAKVDDFDERGAHPSRTREP